MRPVGHESLQAIRPWLTALRTGLRVTRAVGWSMCMHADGARQLGLWSQCHVSPQTPVVGPASHCYSEAGGFAVIFWKALCDQINCSCYRNMKVFVWGSWDQREELVLCSMISIISSPTPQLQRTKPGVPGTAALWTQETSWSTNTTLPKVPLQNQVCCILCYSNATTFFQPAARFLNPADYFY